MLYAFVEGSTAIIGAADTHAEFEALNPESLAHMGGVARFANANDIFHDPRMHGLVTAMVLDYESHAAALASLISNGVEVLPKIKVVTRQKKMAKAAQTDLFDDKRTLAEIFDLVENDPWDTTSPEDKAKLKEKFEKAKKDGTMSGDSFDPDQATGDESLARIWDVKARSVNGVIEVDSAIAIKGSLDTGEERERGPNPYRIDTTDYAKVFRVDVMGLSVVQVDAALAGNGTTFDRISVAHGDIDAVDVDEGFAVGTWVACGLQRLATRVADIVRDTYPDIPVDVEIYDVNLEGERLMPKGIKSGVAMAVEEGREIGPRPWDAPEKAALFHAEFDKLSEEDRKTWWTKNIKGGEFVFAGSWDDHTGTTIFVVPIGHWNREHTLYDDHVDLSHLISHEFIMEAPNRYRARSVQWNIATHMLEGNGLRESMAVRLLLNSIANLSV